MKAVLFDFDGTLVNLPIDYISTRRRLKGLFFQFGVKSDFYPLLESIENSLSELKLKGFGKTSMEEIRRKAHAIINEEERKSVECAKLIDGAKEMLALIKEKQFKIAIVSRNGRECIEKCILKLGMSKPDLVVARENTEKLKPDPQHLDIALKRLGLKPEEVVLVGDSCHDIAAGKKMGITTVLFVSKKKKDMIKLVPDYVISNLSEVLNFVKRWERS